MAGFLRQKGKDVRVVNVEPDPAPLRLPRPRRHPVRALRDGGPPGRPGRPRGGRDPRPLGLEPARRHGRLGPRVRRPEGGDRPPRQPGRPRRDLPEGHLGRGDRHARRPGDPRRWAARSRREVATGLLTAIAMDTGWFRHPNTKPQTLRTAAELVESGAEIDEIYRLLFERNTLGRLKLMGETLAGLQTDAGRPDRLRHRHPRRHRADRRDPARTPRTWSTTPSASRASRSACCSSSRRGAGSS